MEKSILDDSERTTLNLTDCKIYTLIYKILMSHSNGLLVGKKFLLSVLLVTGQKNQKWKKKEMNLY